MKTDRLFSIILLLTCSWFLERIEASTTDVEADKEEVAKVLPYQFSIPEKAIVLSGDSSKINPDVIAVIYDADNLAFDDPSVPRFQFFDRQGKTILGIGGQMAVFGYLDFGGMVDGYEFDVWNIGVPTSPMQKSHIGASPSQSAIFLKLAHSTKLGVFSMYINANFAQGENKNSFGLRQAYVSLAGFTAGYARSTFSDPGATMPTIDPFGPIGNVSKRNILFSYRKNFKSHFYGTISVEMPKATYTTDNSVEKLHQKVPDIPLNLQYTWFNGSHIRFSAILRNLPYKDLLTNRNKLVTGYGFLLSGLIAPNKFVDIIYQISYGRGIGYYIKGTSGHGVDLIYGEKPGEMIAPPVFAFVGGVEVNLSKNVYMTASYSMARLYEQSHLGGDMFRRGAYINANTFWSPLDGLQVGIGYIHGRKTDVSLESGVSNRLLAMVKYSF